MNVLFKNLPIGITAYELSELIETAFNESGVDMEELHISVGAVEMLEIQDNFTKPIEQFGVVRISPPEVAVKVIKQLNGSVVNQFQITVRQYFIRSRDNDPRLKDIDNKDGFLLKRNKDRRKNNRMLKVRSEDDRRLGDRRVNARRMEDRVQDERRVKDRRVKERRIHSLVHSRLI